MKTTEAARCKWRAILPQFGIDAKFLDGRHHACPCNGEGKDRFRFTDQDGSGSFFCACSKGDGGGFALLKCKTGREFADLAREVDGIIGNTSEPEKRERTYAERLLELGIAKPAPRSAYLESRGLEMAPGLRFAKEVQYRDGDHVRDFAAMLGPITRGGKFQTFHVTYLQNGRKAPVDPCRKILPGGNIVGGGIELYPAAEEMGVAEGIETAIAAKMMWNCPTHSALNTGMLAKWDPPAIARKVYIFADNDANYAGRAAAWQLAHRLKLKSIEPIVMEPQSPGDWNDCLIQTRAA